MSKTQKICKSIAVQTDLKCRHCNNVSKNNDTRKLHFEVAIQTEWSAFGGNFYFESFDKNDNCADDYCKNCLVTDVISIGDHLQCNSHPCASCLDCKYVNNCNNSCEEVGGLNAPKKFCPSLPESACISVDSVNVGSRFTKKGRKLKKTRALSKKKQIVDSTKNNSKSSNLVVDGHDALSGNFDVSHHEINCNGDGKDESDFEPLPESSREDGQLDRVDEKKRNLKRKVLVKDKISKKRLVHKTNYISAGLYSDQFKSNSKTLAINSKQTPNIFARPIHYGKHLMNVEADFQLPYDIWMLSNNATKKKLNPSLVYKKIKNNIYIDVRPVCKDSEPSQCNCRPPSDPQEEGCTDNCLNRMVYTECVSDLCACGDRCGNQRIQKHQAFEGLGEFPTKDRGYGVQALKPIAAGQFIMEYVGEVVSEQEFRRRMTDLYSGMEHHYCLSLSGGSVIDGYKCGNISRLINHSCSPNCEMQKWNVNGVPRIGLFALKDIEVTEELTYDYNFRAYNIDAQQECRCGTKNCRKVVGFRSQREERKARSSKVGFTMSFDKNNRSQILQHYFSSSGYDGTPTMRERKLIWRKVLLLSRNLKKSRRAAGLGEVDKEGVDREDDEAMKTEVFKTQFIAINTSRSVRTRQLTKSEDDDIISRMTFLAQVFMQVFNDVVNSPDVFGNTSSKLTYHLPSKRKFLTLHDPRTDLIDLTTIAYNINSGKYSTSLAFHEDFVRFFNMAEKIENNETTLELMKSRYFSSLENTRSFLETIGDALPMDLKSLPPSPPPSSPLTSSSSSPSAMQPLSSMSQLSPLPSLSPPPSSPLNFALALSSSSSSLSHTHPTLLETDSTFQFEVQAGVDDDDVIGCICGLYLDEGVMLQCENCRAWQHQTCMMADVNEEDYLCHVCGPRKVSKEVLLSVQPSNGESDCLYYMTLMRGDLQLRVGETIYVLDEEGLSLFTSSSSSSLSRLTELQLADAYRNLLGDVDKLDMFMIDNLWVDARGRRLMHGHYYLRPHEVSNHGNMMFLRKEVFNATTTCVTLPITCAIGYCCVMDVESYSLGRPREFRERDVYVCEFKVDKNKRMIKRPMKFNHPTNKATFCFNRFAKKVVFKRDYMPRNNNNITTTRLKSTNTPVVVEEDKTRGQQNSSLKHDNNNSDTFKIHNKHLEIGTNLSKTEDKQKNLESVIRKITKECNVSMETT